MKGLPLAYNKDMQEDKEGVFDSVSTILSSATILNEMIKTAKFNEKNMLKATKTGHLSATDLADYLVREKNIPFRTAHFITGKAVAKAESLGLDLSELNKEQLKSVDENLDENIKEFMKSINLEPNQVGKFVYKQDLYSFDAKKPYFVLPISSATNENIDELKFALLELLKKEL